MGEAGQLRGPVRAERPRVLKLIERDRLQRRELQEFLTINVSEFFRDPDQFETLKRLVLPQPVDAGHRLSVWSAGCSLGVEAHSVAVMLADLDPEAHHRIFATDIYTVVLDRIRSAQGD